MKHYILCLVVLGNITYVLSGIFTRGNTQCTLEFINPCKNDHPTSELILNYVRCNKTHRCVRGYFDLIEPTDKELMVDIIASKWGDGGWKNNAFHWRLPDACNSIAKIIGKNWRDIARNTGEESCPFHAGRHNITDFYVDFSDMPVAFMYGKYNIVFRIIKHEQLRLCREFVLNVA